MDGGEERKPLLVGRGVLLFEDFCRHTGLDEDIVEPLMRSGRLAGALWRQDGRPFGVFDDVLPTAHDLQALGLTVSESYDPDRLCSHENDDQDDLSEDG